MSVSISIIIPAFNNLSLFKRAISSALNQSRPPCEIIVSDDSSSDVIKEYVDSLGSSLVRYYHNVPSLGAVLNWNAGIEKSSGDWIIVMHHDEELGDSDYLKRIGKKIKESGDTEIIVSDFRIKSSMGLHKGHFNKVVKKLLLNVPHSILCANFIGPCACMTVKNSVIDDFDPNLTWLVDIEWYFKLLKTSEKSIFCPDLLIISNHGHPDQITNNIDIKKKHSEDKNYLRQKYRQNRGVMYALKISDILSPIRRILKR